MVVSSHFISSNWTLKSQILSFQEILTFHTGLAIADQLLSTILDWKIANKVAFITVNNASSNNVVIA
jgi:hypothetical protein